MSDLIDDLDSLRIALLSFSDRLEKSGVERTTGLKANLGDDCPYYKKSKDVFLNRDYDQVKDLFLKVLDQYRIVEGQSFGR
jgi:hypothetical protein